MCRALLCAVEAVSCRYFCFFFKQKTAYEMRISDWSSDVCSSDLEVGALHEMGVGANPENGDGDLPFCWRVQPLRAGLQDPAEQRIPPLLGYQSEKIGRASCRERVCQYV